MSATYADRINGVETAIAIKAPVRVVTSANIALSGLQVIDGVTLESGDRVLVKDQTNASDNGIWDASATAWTRSIDFNGARDIARGTLISVNEGTVNSGRTFCVTTDSPIIGDDLEIERTPASIAIDDVNAASATLARQFDTVPALIADEVLSYTAGTGKTVVTAGEYVTTRDGFAYQVAASGASDHDVTTAGGVKLYVLPIAGWIETAAFGGPSGVASDTSDFAPTLRKAIAVASALWDVGRPTNVRVSARGGMFYVKSFVGNNVVQCDRPILIDLNHSTISVDAAVNDKIVFQFVRLGFANESNPGATMYPTNGNTAFNSISDLRVRAGLVNGHITGNRTVTQHAVRFIGNVDNFIARDLDITYFSGRALWLGAADGDIRGQVRESFFDNIRIRNCGKTDGTAALTIQKVASPGNTSADSSNLLYFGRIEVVFPYGRGVEVIGEGLGSTPIYGLHFSSLMLHGRKDAPETNGALFHIEGSVVNLRAWVDVARQKGAEAAVRIAPATDGTRPNGVTLDLSLPSADRGVNIVNGQDIDIIIRHAYSTGYLVRAEGTMTGAFSVDAIGADHEITIPAAFTVTAGVSSVMNLSGVTGIDTFFGDATSVECALNGNFGTLSYSGTTASCTFTATDTGWTTSIADGIGVLSKIMIPATLLANYSGRYYGRLISRLRQSRVLLRDALAQLGDNTRWESSTTRYAYMRTQADSLILGVTNNAGVENNLLQFMSNSSDPRTFTPRPFTVGGAWNGGNLIRLGSWRFWLDADGRLRKKASDPTSDTDGDLITQFVSPPASATAFGHAGDISANASFIYVCFGNNQWARVAASSSGW